MIGQSSQNIPTFINFVHSRASCCQICKRFSRLSETTAISSKNISIMPVLCLILQIYIVLCSKLCWYNPTDPSRQLGETTDAVNFLWKKTENRKGFLDRGFSYDSPPRKTKLTTQTIKQGCVPGLQRNIIFFVKHSTFWSYFERGFNWTRHNLFEIYFELSIWRYKGIRWRIICKFQSQTTFSP